MQKILDFNRDILKKKYYDAILTAEYVAGGEQLQFFKYSSIQ